MLLSWAASQKVVARVFWVVARWYWLRSKELTPLSDILVYDSDSSLNDCCTCFIIYQEKYIQYVWWIGDRKHKHSLIFFIWNKNVSSYINCDGRWCVGNVNTVWCVCSCSSHDWMAHAVTSGFYKTLSRCVCVSVHACVCIHESYMTNSLTSDVFNASQNNICNSFYLCIVMYLTESLYDGTWFHPLGFELDCEKCVWGEGNKNEALMIVKKKSLKGLMKDYEGFYYTV